MRGWSQRGLWLLADSQQAYISHILEGLELFVVYVGLCIWPKFARYYNIGYETCGSPF